jgi:hypothetical protein
MKTTNENKTQCDHDDVPSMAREQRSLLVATFYTTALLAVHVQAEHSTSSSTAETFHERLQQGPTALSHWDILLFGGISYLGFELMSYAALNTGEWLHAKRVPVRGKHLDVLSTVRITKSYSRTCMQCSVKCQ